MKVVRYEQLTRSEVQSTAGDASTNNGDGENDASFDVSECGSITGDESGVNRDSDEPIFWKARSAQATADVDLGLDEMNVDEKPPELAGSPSAS